MSPYIQCWEHFYVLTLVEIHTQADDISKNMLWCQSPKQKNQVGLNFTDFGIIPTLQVERNWYFGSHIDA